MNGDSGGLQLCASESLEDGRHLKLDILFEGSPQSMILLRFKGQPYAYLNRCVHMPKALDCLAETIFDETAQRLRCSMHGIVYEPTTGTSLSVICEGKQLVAIEISESEGGIVATDYRVVATPSA